MDSIPYYSLFKTTGKLFASTCKPHIVVDTLWTMKVSSGHFLYLDIQSLTVQAVMQHSRSRLPALSGAESLTISSRLRQTLSRQTPNTFRITDGFPGHPASPASPASGLLLFCAKLVTCTCKEMVVFRINFLNKFSSDII